MQNHHVTQQQKPVSFFAGENLPGKKRLAETNYLKLVEMIDCIFELYSRVLVVRLDLKYKPEHRDKVHIFMAKEHRDRFFRWNIDNEHWPYSVFDHLIAYAWNFEFGDDGCGYHFHVLLFYDGAKRQQDITIAQEMSARWSKATGDKGYTYIVNCDKDKMAKNGTLGVGMIHRGDVDLRKNLVERVAGYMTKKTSVFESAVRDLDGRFRTYGRSWMLKRPDQNKPRRGRPPIINLANLY